MKEIIPAILTDDFSEFQKQVARLEKIVSKAQIDIMDGKFVAGKSFSEIEKINSLNSPLLWEIHLMVSKPLEELKKWTEVKNVFRVIFHIESTGDAQKIIEEIKKHNWQVGIAINPETPTDKLTPYLSQISEVLFLTVHPGRQGSELERKVLKKIKDFAKISGRPLVAADGGINTENISEIGESGVEIFNIGSAITMTSEPELVYKKLKKILTE